MIRPVLLLALAAIVSMSVATPRAAGSCCACATSCVPPAPVMVMVPVEPFYVKPIYIVNQGPVYGGPGLITRPLKKDFNTPLSDYPYVSRDHYYPSYEYYAVPKRRYVRHRYYK